MTIYSVGEITEQIKALLDRSPDLCNVQIAGEISNFKYYASSGHCYFSLKDREAVLKCVMFRSNAQFLRFKPKDGDKVLAVGSIQVYKAGGVYQLYVDLLQEQGTGSLMLAYEKLKNRLQAEGLFAQERKQTLPDHIESIGIITSPLGAAVRDIIKVAQGRNPGIKLYLYPVKVQGQGAAQEIVQAIKFFNKNKLAQALIVGRGGGSIEDLWAFNEEPVVRAVAASKLPIVSAVGHETDFTLCDFAADVRAATPSHGAELLTQDVMAVKQQLDNLTNRCKWLFFNRVMTAEAALERASKGLSHPERLFASQEQTLDYKEAALKKAMAHLAEAYSQRLSLQVARLEGLSPLGVLSRGYSLTESQGRPIASVAGLKVGQELESIFADGSAYSQITRVERRNNNGSKED